jgi:hypothetical protein
LEPETAEYNAALSKCRAAQSNDYSCQAFENDPEVKSRGQAMGNCLEKYPAGSEDPGLVIRCLDSQYPAAAECSQARSNLSAFQDRVKKAMLDAELRDAFAPPQPIVISPPPETPIVIREAPTAPNFLAPPSVPSPPVFTNCANFGATTNCITH